LHLFIKRDVGVDLTADLGTIRVVWRLKSDAPFVQLALSNNQLDSSAAAEVIEDMKFQCKTWFSACTISTLPIRQL
jgi:hypothetical protein